MTNHLGLSVNPTQISASWIYMEELHSLYIYHSTSVLVFLYKDRRIGPGYHAYITYTPS